MVDGDDATEMSAPGSEPQQSQVRRRYELPAERTDARDPHRRPTLKTPRPRLGLGAIPRRLVDDRQLFALALEPRAAFVLSQIDGRTPVRTLVDVTGMQADEVVVLVERLLELHAISVL